MAHENTVRPTFMACWKKNCSSESRPPRHHRHSTESTPFRSHHPTPSKGSLGTALCKKGKSPGRVTSLRILSSFAPQVRQEPYTDLQMLSLLCGVLHGRISTRMKHRCCRQIGTPRRDNTYWHSIQFSLGAKQHNHGSSRRVTIILRC